MAQVPQGMNYQAVARNNSGAELSNMSIDVQVAIHQSAPLGALAYTEFHSVVTNPFGLFTITIGSKDTIAFSNINWPVGPYYLEILLDTTASASNYVSMGSTQLMAVPYALYAKNSGNGPPGAQGPQGVQGPAGPPGVAGSMDAWSRIGNAGTVAGTNFLGTTDNQDLVVKTNNLERFRITSGGSIGLGTSNPLTKFSIHDFAAKANFFSYNSVATGGTLKLGLSRGTEISPLGIQQGDHLGSVIFSGHNGTSFMDASAILGRASQNFTSNGNGTILEFKTTRDDTTGSETRMIIDNIGRVGIGKTPIQALDVKGTINVSGGFGNEVNRSNTSNADLLPIAYGSIDANGNILTSNSGNFILFKLGIGIYEIGFTDGFNSLNFTVVSTLASGPGEISASNAFTGSSPGKFKVKTYNSSGVAVDKDFNFVVYKP